MKTADVVIVGAGLAGLQCARLLARRGSRGAGRSETISGTVHTHNRNFRPTHTQDFDIPADCLGPPLRHVTLYSPSRRTMELASPHDEFRIGRMGPLYTRYLDHCLRAGVE